jgi:catechol 2,3-dioxygenase-like lactoylglutathione lyase family enzyme
MTTIVIDHVALLGRDVHAMRVAFERLGFTPTPSKLLMRWDAKTGERESLKQESSHAVLEHGYIELAAVLTDEPQHYLTPYLRRYPGLHVLAFRSTDIDADHARCLAAGFEPTPVIIATRDVEYGTRQGAAQFRWFMLGGETTPEGLLCYVHNHTPELVFQPEVMNHPNSALGLHGVTIVASKPERIAEHYRALLGLEPIAADEELRFEPGQQSIRIMTRHAFIARYPGAGVPVMPCLRAFDVIVRDIGAARAYLNATRVRHQVREDGSLWVGPRSACGAALRFIGTGL